MNKIICIAGISASAIFLSGCGGRDSKPAVPLENKSISGIWYGSVSYFVGDTYDSVGPLTESEETSLITLGSDDFSYDGSYTVESEGIINGRDINGCVFNGSVSLIKASYNLYQVTFSVNNCGAFDGEYSGLGVHVNWDINEDNDAFLFSATGPNYMISSMLQRT